MYQTIEDLIEAVRYDKHPIDEFETCCFSGSYITGDVDKSYLDALEQRRSDRAQSKENMTDDLTVL